MDAAVCGGDDGDGGADGDDGGDDDVCVFSSYFFHDHARDAYVVEDADGVPRVASRPESDPKAS